MKRIFIDTDILMDFLLRRKPFAQEAMKIMEYGYRKKLHLNVSTLCLNNIHYLVSRLENKNKARRKIKDLLKLVEPQPVSKQAVEKAAYSNFKDFEDAIQNFCAEENGLTRIITRNVKDYATSDLAIQTPREFILDFESTL